MVRSLRNAIFTLIISLLSCLPSFGQKVQWASEVLEFSSELTPLQYSAQQVTGKPNVLPSAGESPNAWTPAHANKPEILKVGFKEPMAIKQIAIAESYNPTTLSKIFIYDEHGVEHSLKAFNPKSIPLKGRMLNIFFEKTPFKVKAVRLEFNGAAVPEYYSIDAIAIADVDMPIIAQIKIAEGLNEEKHIERLNDKINSKYKEYKPLLSPDGKTLYFSRKNHPENAGGIKDPEDIWFSEWDSVKGEWTLAENLGALNNEGPNFISSITPDGKTIVLLKGNDYLKDGQSMPGVTISNKTAEGWSQPMDVEIENDYNLSDKANFFLANNRKVLLMSVEREDTKGNRDLYAAFLKNDSTWSEPVNLGPQVNSAAEEFAPFLAMDGKTLYFSSDGFSGYGKADIYVTKRLDDSWVKWSEPSNLGADINSELNDMFFNIPLAGEFAFYAREVDENDIDIFKVKVPLFKRPDPVILVKGKTQNANTRNAVEAQIFYKTLPDGKKTGTIKSDPGTGEFELMLPAGESYRIKVIADGYMEETLPMDLSGIEEHDVTINNRNVNLVPVKDPNKNYVGTIFFDFDKSDLKKESVDELNKIIKILDQDSSKVLSLAAHTDATGSESYNTFLAKRRALAVIDYLKQQGINGDRISVKYFGEGKPAASNSTAEGRQKNRRIDFIVTKD